jgi:hypothetical protein
MNVSLATMAIIMLLALTTAMSCSCIVCPLLNLLQHVEAQRAITVSGKLPEIKQHNNWCTSYEQSVPR